MACKTKTCRTCGWALNKNHVCLIKGVAIRHDLNLPVVCKSHKTPDEVAKIRGRANPKPEDDHA